MSGEFDTDDPRVVGLYIGVVVDREDPEGLGRVRIRIPGLIEPASGWAFPLGTVGGGSNSRGFFAVPEKGAEVGVFFHQGEIDHPFFLSGHWGKPDGQTEVPTPIRDLSKTDSPNVRAFETKRFLLVFDDREGKEQLAIQDKTSGDRVLLDASNGIEVKSSNVTVKADSVTIADGSQGAARQNDDVDLNPAMQQWMTGVVSAIASLGGTAQPFVGTTFGTISGGSSKVKIG